MPEANGAVLMRHTSQRDALADEQVACEQALVAFVAVDAALSLLLHHAPQFGDEALVPFFVIGLVGENDVALTVERGSVLRVRQVL
jgi:hypothetical protein